MTSAIWPCGRIPLCLRGGIETAHAPGFDWKERIQAHLVAVRATAARKAGDVEELALGEAVSGELADTTRSTEQPTKQM